jgi:hypothetical protein
MLRVSLMPLQTYDIAQPEAQKVKRERRTWGAVKHPNILPLYGFADDEDLFQPFGALISPVSIYLSNLTGF